MRQYVCTVFDRRRVLPYIGVGTFGLNISDLAGLFNRGTTTHHPKSSACHLIINIFTKNWSGMPATIDVEFFGHFVSFLKKRGLLNPLSSECMSFLCSQKKSCMPRPWDGSYRIVSSSIDRSGFGWGFEFLKRGSLKEEKNGACTSTAACVIVYTYQVCILSRWVVIGLEFFFLCFLFLKFGSWSEDGASAGWGAPLRKRFCSLTLFVSTRGGVKGCLSTKEG